MSIVSDAFMMRSVQTRYYSGKMCESGIGQWTDVLNVTRMREGWRIGTVIFSKYDTALIYLFFSYTLGTPLYKSDCIISHETRFTLPDIRFDLLCNLICTWLLFVLSCPVGMIGRSLYQYERNISRKVRIALKTKNMRVCFDIKILIIVNDYYKFLFHKFLDVIYLSTY